MENNIFASKIKKVRKWFVGTRTKAERQNVTTKLNEYGKI